VLERQVDRGPDLVLGDPRDEVLHRVDDEQPAVRHDIDDELDEGLGAVEQVRRDRSRPRPQEPVQRRPVGLGDHPPE
jgi:hypothetical protein